MPVSTTDPKWPSALHWLQTGGSPDVSSLGIIGAPVTLGSITPGRHYDLGPNSIRESLAGFSTYDLDNAIDLLEIRAEDFGDLPVETLDPAEAFDPIVSGIRSALSRQPVLIVLGGNNSITRAGCHGIGESLSSCGLLTFDAHFDVRDLQYGLNNGNPIRALLKDGLSGSHIVQIGAHSYCNSKSYFEIARTAGITLATAQAVRARGVDTVVSRALEYLSTVTETIYVDLDLDVLDRTLAPACPGSRPDGLTLWDLRVAARLCGLHPKVRALDIVELDPTLDLASATTMAAANCLLSFCGGYLERSRASKLPIT
jgi:formiminoglutamase